jgi:hypothetical protein
MIVTAPPSWPQPAKHRSSINSEAGGDDRVRDAVLAKLLRRVYGTGSLQRVTIVVTHPSGRADGYRHPPQRYQRNRVRLLEADYRLGQHVLPGRNSGRTGEMLSETQVACYIKRNIPASVYHPPGDICRPIRRAVASNLGRNGVDTDTIDKLLGWAPTSLRADRYMAYESDDPSSAIIRLWSDDPL